MTQKPIAVVTGASGFVGSHLVDLLLSKNYSVRVITRKTSSLHWLKDKEIEVFDCGLTNEEELEKAFKGAEYIYHVAGVVKSKKPEGYFYGNVETTRHLLEAALTIKDSLKKFLIVSSLTASGPSTPDNPVNEEMACSPITTYGRSKLAEEELAKTYMDRLPITICRAPAVYGERDTEILIFFKTFKKGLMTTIGSNNKIISLIHVIDLVNGFYLAATNSNSTGQIYFISSEKFYTWDEIGKVTEKIVGNKPFKVSVPHSMVYSIAAVAQFFAMFSSKPATLNIEKAKDITQQAWICDISKAKKELNYNQNISLEEGIGRTIAWYKDMKWI
ncbi:MAG: NAD(P)-dependent oxidoreductase [Ignavibacteriaceae bacterium]|nr:NAD(P)-dependent oxidoreductase [Ignavibacteriaceae bacterium]